MKYCPKNHCLASCERIQLILNPILNAMVMYFLTLLIFIPISIAFGIKYTIKRQRGQVDPKNEVDISGKIVIVTGASDGIGKVTAEELSTRGARVILACRNEQKTKQVVENIRSRTKNGELIFMHLDLASLSSVRSFASEFISKYGGPSSPGLSILVNNAGIINPVSVRKVTGDGYEETFQINHLGHFLLTTLLLPELERAAETESNSSASRIINVSSGSHIYGELNFEDIMHESKPPVEKSPVIPISAYYSNSKLANVLFTLELAKRSRAKGVKVNSYALCPGYVETNVEADLRDLKYPSILMNYVVFPFARFFMMKNAKEGAQTTIYCALSKYLEHHSGEMYRNCEFWDYSRRPKLRAEDAAKLWEISEQLVNSK